MKALLTAFALASAVTAAAAQAQTPPSTYAVSTQAKIEYAQHDGVTLTGDLYLPKGLDKAPVVIAVHGGGWQAGSPITYRHWGPFLAKNGYAVFAISYRLSKPGAKTFPGAVYDVKAAIQFVRANAARLGIDPDRIGLMGDSAGAHLAALVALAGDEPLFSTEYRNDPHVATAANVKSVIGFYGVYDMQAQWLHDQITRPRDQITEKFLGVVADAEPPHLFRCLADELRHRREERKDQDALSAHPRHQRRHRRSADPVAGVPDRAQAGRLLCAQHRRSRLGAFLGERAGRGAGQLRRPGRPADAAFPAGRAVTGEEHDPAPASRRT